MTDEPIDFLEKRWNGGSNQPDAYTPREALLAAIRRIDSGEITPDHVIICMGACNPEDAFISTVYTQAGSFNPYAQIGLLDRVAHRMRHFDRD